ncbi:hypothetical protein R1flu_018786 [Riccia fluitans]|uniref:Uncharacterized protein n=1 Tax=Riccia fluitans TaxID=41844 RepID=A0ABD1ZGZ8_9MARC
MLIWCVITEQAATHADQLLVHCIKLVRRSLGCQSTLQMDYFRVSSFVASVPFVVVCLRKSEFAFFILFLSEAKVCRVMIRYVKIPVLTLLDTCSEGLQERFHQESDHSTTQVAGSNEAVLKVVLSNTFHWARQR